jgi:hypothetical protein
MNGLRFFAAGAGIALVMAALMWLPPLRVIAAVALVQAALGVAVCAWMISAERMMAVPSTHR